MGRSVRARPERLAEKLLYIRERLRLSQNELIRWMGLEDELMQRDISAYELGKREPTLMTLLKLAKAVGGKEGTGRCLEMLLDDTLDFRLPRASAGKARSQSRTVNTSSVKRKKTTR
jgi:transcriptional regulator with XRE-family HTH domain